MPFSTARPSAFPASRPGRLWLTEGGIETEIMYKWGHDLPHFAMFPLLERADAAADIRGMYRRYLDVAARHGFAALIGGFDYRAIAFLRELAREYEDSLPDARIVGYVGPRGDAYALNCTITEDEAADYHAVQLATLKRAGVDLAWAVTFNEPAEARGVVQAARALGVPLALSFSLTSDSRLASGQTLAEAVQLVDAASDGYPAFYALNCSHPLEFKPALTPGAWQRRLRCIRPNAAAMDKIALCKLGHLEEGDPHELGRQMAGVARRFPQMDIWGGCYGTCETHLDEIARRVAHVRAEVPA